MALQLRVGTTTTTSALVSQRPFRLASFPGSQLRCSSDLLLTHCLFVGERLQNMAKAAEDMEGMESAKLEEMGEEMMEEMMKKFEGMGEKVVFLNTRRFGSKCVHFENTDAHSWCRAISKTWSMA